MQAHAHSLFWPPTGELEVVVNAERWPAGPTQAVWVPASTSFRIEPARHSPLFRVAVPTVAHGAQSLPELPRVVPVDGDLRTSILTYISGRLRGAQLDVQPVVDALRRVGRPQVSVTQPVNATARELAIAIERQPASPPSLTQWAADSGTSTRTLLRRFRAESGCTVAQYTLRVRMRLALKLLDQNVSLTDVALQCGYRSTTSFLAAFRRTFGAPPAAYGYVFDEQPE